MPGSTLKVQDALREIARTYADRSHAPYSGRSSAAVLLLSDGYWIPGVKVESASFSLTIPAVQNAYTTAVALNRTDMLAIVQTETIRKAEEVYLAALPGGHVRRDADDVFVIDGVSELPEPVGPLDPFISGARSGDLDEAISAVRQIAARAYVPESDFRVGAVLVDGEGRWIPGVNVEHEDWSRILCAERNALGTAISYGIRDLRSLYLTCSRDAACTPCGACRQLLAELAPDIVLKLDRGQEPPDEKKPHELLPGFFSGDKLSR